MPLVFMHVWMSVWNVATKFRAIAEKMAANNSGCCFLLLLYVPPPMRFFVLSCLSVCVTAGRISNEVFERFVAV